MYTVFSKDVGGGYRVILSQQHKVLTDIDKGFLLASICMFPSTKLLPQDIRSQLLVAYGLILGLLFGRASNLIVLHILSNTVYVYTFLFGLLTYYVVFT